MVVVDDDVVVVEEVVVVVSPGGSVSVLVVLYSINVFLTFTLSLLS